MSPLSPGDMIPLEFVLWNQETNTLSVVANVPGRVVKNSPSARFVVVDVLDHLTYMTTPTSTVWSLRSAPGTNMPNIRMSKRTGIEHGSCLDEGCFRINPVALKELCP